MTGCLCNNLEKAWSVFCQDANAMVLCDRAAIKEILATKGVLGLGGGTWLKNAGTFCFRGTDLSEKSILEICTCGTELFLGSYVFFALCPTLLYFAKVSLCVMKRCVPVWASQRWENAIQCDVQLSVLRDQRPRDLVL